MTTYHASFGEVLTNVGADDRLLSYYYLKDEADNFLESIVRTGLYPPKERIRFMKPNFDRSAYVKRRKLEIARRAEQVEE